MPFFVVGATHGQVILRTAGRIAVQWKIAGVVALAGAWLYLYYRDTRPGWLYGSFSFERLDTQDPQGVLFRIGLLFIASAAIFVFLSLMPDKDGMPAMLGRRSLAIYLMHGFVVLAITLYLPLILDQTNSIVAFVAAVLLTVLTVALFALPVFDQLIRWFSQFIVRQISKPLVLAYQRLWEPRN
ncbi:acyltransferase family protein [Glutamicibacter arilaitensis]|uniref:acyltransferase family protein n=1 Tax=Glutamicibacter arilaitensis TaxID=256701 RepID=UPI003F8E0440